jgi:hypothetical protein
MSWVKNFYSTLGDQSSEIELENKAFCTAPLVLTSSIIQLCSCSGQLSVRLLHQLLASSWKNGSATLDSREQAVVMSWKLPAASSGPYTDRDRCCAVVWVKLRTKEPPEPPLLVISNPKKTNGFHERPPDSSLTFSCFFLESMAYAESGSLNVVRTDNRGETHPFW